MLSNNKSRVITQEELQARFLEHYKDNTFVSLLKFCEWHDKLNKWGFLPVFRNIDFSQLLPEPSLLLYMCMFHGVQFINCKGLDYLRGCTFHKCVFENCQFDSTTFTSCDFHHSQFTRCQFNSCWLLKVDFNQSTLTDCQFRQTYFYKTLIDTENYANNDLDWSNNLFKTSWEKLHYQKQSQTQVVSDKPIIVLVYSPEDGVTNTDQLIRFLQKQNRTTIILIHPNRGLSHPILSNGFDGLILTGGPHIHAEGGETIRTETETALLAQALGQDKPVLGICRGHQLICNKVFNAEITNVLDHVAEQHRIFVNPKSKLNHLLHSFSEKDSLDKKVLTNKFGMFRIKSPHCYHQQGTYLIGDHYENIVSMRTADGVVEGIEYGKIFTLQHHYEDELSKPSPAGRLGRAVIEQFIIETEKQKLLSYIPDADTRFQCRL